MKKSAEVDPTGIGQNHEWQIWSNLTWGAGADLHVFLPTKDMGVDGIVRRPATDLMVPVQAKGRTHLDPGNILRVRVQENEASDDRVKVIVVVSGPDGPELRRLSPDAERLPRVSRQRVQRVPAAPSCDRRYLGRPGEVHRGLAGVSERHRACHAAQFPRVAARESGGVLGAAG